MAGPSWRDRLKPSAYTSPSGERQAFKYRDVSRSWEKRGKMWQFPGVDGGWGQQRGNGPREYPCLVVFSGPSHDLDAAKFEASLWESGRGKLEHPMYGPVDVIPMGTVNRRDDLKSAANETIFQVTFSTSLASVYPQAQLLPQSEILSALDAFDAAAGLQFADAMDLDSVVKKANAIASIRESIKSIGAVFDTAAGFVGEVRAGFAEVESIINLSIDNLIGKPILLASRISNLINAPANSLEGILDRLDGYGRFAESIFASEAGNPGTSLAGGVSLTLNTTRIANDFHASDLFAAGAVGGSVRSAVGHTFETKPAVLQAAATVLDQFDALVNWKDQGMSDLSQVAEIGPYQIDSGGAVQSLQDAVWRCAGNLVQSSFTLIPERRITLDRARTIVDLAAELYGSVDDQLDRIISNNHLTGDEILELPRGKTIVYYARQ